MSLRIAVVDAACEYPEARTPYELWQVALHSRQCFRRFPSERLAIADYLRENNDPDGIYSIEAALIEGYSFDRKRFLIPLPLFQGTDMAHWMALDVASRAILPLNGLLNNPDLRDRTAVIVANTLTGEFSRANLMRYRWPYVERTASVVAEHYLPHTEISRFLDSLESAYKAPFPPPDEDSLAGGLSNTIAGRIANHYGFRGGAHSVDGACASSLIAIVTACEKLMAGDITCAVVGAVDLSLDPFELVGFARNGALARDGMRVFDRDSNGFWPGEGCAFIVLANEVLAAEKKWPVLGWIQGVGMSTDGHGGLTRPTADGQLLALHRAWRRAGLSPLSADYFEAHGTGTATGDPVELSALAELLRDGRPAQPVPVGTIKANIGHTKAAAGMAGLLKALAVCKERIIPATTGCEHPHSSFEDTFVAERLRIPFTSEKIKHNNAITVGINSFGFGGVNCHVVLQGANPVTSPSKSLPLRISEDARLHGELITLDAQTREDLVNRLALVEERAGILARSQLVDLAASLEPTQQAGWRACLVAGTPQQLELVAREARNSLIEQTQLTRRIGPEYSWSAPDEGLPRIAFLFPGQGLLPFDVQPQAWAKRFPMIVESALRLEELCKGDLRDTAVMQPMLAEISLAGLTLLSEFQVSPWVAIGHSFGELPALHASGYFSAESLRQLSLTRGSCMRDHSPTGAMLALEATIEVATAMAVRHGVDVACENAQHRQVLSGSIESISAVAKECESHGIRSSILPTTRAFHSRLMGEARDVFAKELQQHQWLTGVFSTISTITGKPIEQEQLTQLLADQLVRPVRFREALASLNQVDLIIEIGVHTPLVDLVKEEVGQPTLPLSLFDRNLTGLLAALGAAWVCGSRLDTQCLYDGRLIRPFSLDDPPKFLANPCGVSRDAVNQYAIQRRPIQKQEIAFSATPDRTVLQMLQHAVVELTGLPIESIAADARLLADLHLNSIRARYVVASVAQQVGIQSLPFNLGEFVNASIDEIAQYLGTLRDGLASEDEPISVPGVAPWLRFLGHMWMPVTLRSDVPDESLFPVQIDDSLAPLPPALREKLAIAGTTATGVTWLVVLPSNESHAILQALLTAAKRLLNADKSSGLLVLQGAQLANAFLQSVSSELPSCRICAVEYESLDMQAIYSAFTEHKVQSQGYSELRLRNGVGERRSVAPISLDSTTGSWSPGANDVVLVSGGARGIGAATSHFIARRYRCRLALVGRRPVDDPEVAETLNILRADGISACYVQVDLADVEATKGAIQDIQSEFGTITALVHAAGVNRPMSIGLLSIEELEDTLRNKVVTLDNLLASISSEQLKLIVAYGSIIGEFGLLGESHYALANEWLTRHVLAYSKLLPSCVCIPICWSAWREVGMAAQLEGVLERLIQMDTRPLENDEALNALARLIEHGKSDPLIVCGRYGRKINAQGDLSVLQKYRYLEFPRVYYPGIELIVDSELSSDSDLYLQDHSPYGVPILPLVSAIEAMLSAAMIVRSTDKLPVIEDIRIATPISCALGQRFVLRVAVLLETDCSLCAEIRCGTSGFSVVHFSCRMNWPDSKTETIRSLPGIDNFPASELLYRGLVFHGPRFQRLDRFRSLSATECCVSTKQAATLRWFGSLLPSTVTGGDPAIRDSALHALQACIPQHPVLPIAVERIELGWLDSNQDYVIVARETHNKGREFTFDIDICLPNGRIVERWIGLRLARVMSERSDVGKCCELSVALIEPFVGRLASEIFLDMGISVGVVVDVPEITATQEAIARVLGSTVSLNYDTDGAPRVKNVFVSATHANGITVVLAHREKQMACDLEFMPLHSNDEWQLMLGGIRYDFATDLARMTAITLEQACLAVWTISECLIKLNYDKWPFNVRLTQRTDGFHAGPFIELRSDELQLVVAFFKLSGKPCEAAIAIASAAIEPGGGVVGLEMFGSTTAIDMGVRVHE
jgi:enediyne polyketide synthase